MLGTTGASAATDDEQHMTVVNDLANVFIRKYCICCTAVGVLRLAIGLEVILRH